MDLLPQHFWKAIPLYIYSFNARRISLIVLTLIDTYYTLVCYGRRDSSVSKSSASQTRDLGSNPGGDLIRVTQCMNEKGRD